MERTAEKNELWEWLKTIGIAILLAWGIQSFLFSPIKVSGASMMPTFEDGDKVVVNKISSKWMELDRFDVIVFESSEDTHYIKRIIGVPGDHIAYKNDELFINGEKYEETYLEEYKKELKGNSKLTGNFVLEESLGEAVVPAGHYFVLGDNRLYSKDSRDPDVGFVSADKVLGTAKIVIWPMSNFGVNK
ncbi:signal peptidase I [Psychrobacillus sp.]|uniref:signal peptidase I n=1 Tax=Psychrobacillus sp. TaxID=1871623 RepID=UPI0028BE770B|nr:signal peptidase I [Psychrobacillus sp.]